MINRRELVQSLVEIVGKKAVLHAPEDLLVFETDASIGAALPWVAVFPSSVEEVSRIVRLGYEEGIPIVARGTGTGISGGAIASEGGILLTLTRMKRILEVDPLNQTAVVESGVVNLDLSKAVSKYGLYYVPDPSSQKVCTIGGNVGTNAGGPHCLAYGVTTNHVLGLEVVLDDGDIVWLGGKTGERPGYDLTGVVVGSEGTLAIVTKIIVRLTHKPEAVKTFLAIFDRMDDASNTVSQIIASGIVPAALEMIDNLVIQAVEQAIHAGFPLDAEAVLLIELDGLRESVEEEAEVVKAICGENRTREIRVAEEEDERERLWAARKGALGALGRLAPNYYILDGVVPPTQLPQVLQKVGELSQRFGFAIANVFHAGDGNLHPNILFDARVPGQSEKVLELGEEVMRICVEAGGAITGEHGIGLEKRSFMEWVFTPDDLEAMGKLKRAFNERDLLNPAKIFPTGKACDGSSVSIRPELMPKGSDEPPVHFPSGSNLGPEDYI